VSVDLAVATPAFLDLNFVGLESLPGPGEERFAGELRRAPGGGAITAIGAARLGLTTALVAPLAEDEAGDLIRRVLHSEGVAVVDPRGPRTPLTVVMPAGGERAMVTVDPGVRARPADVAAVEPRAVSISLDQLDLLPPGAHAYVTCGDDDARAFSRRLPRGLAGIRALIVNQREARALTGTEDPAEAARQLGEIAAGAVVTLGAQGAVAAVDGELLTVPGMDAGPAVDPTGAEDLFAAAYAWADLRGADIADRVRWAVLGAALSVTAPTGVGGAVSRARLLEEGTRRGLPAPPG
jgi:ribokinase